MRLFTAIDLPGEALQRLETLIDSLRPLARLQWSPAANLHITTRFIGEWPDERLPELRSALSRIPCREAIPIRVGGLGFYPHARSPRVFYAGVGAAPELAALAADIDASLETLGLRREPRPYSPHLTLARIKSPGGLAAFHKEVVRLGQPHFGSFTADRFFLYHSRTSPSGSVYTKLSDFPISKE
ncbi:MAG TPA: RNA 2',3'-cyclic phosphodiesterase [Bryobacteraceae bacterium]|jgi:2'-5' RNA ligase|nr:RNA 2',3'-cyclic phosphodiesterase [Bryobacteraceae bacterium]